MTFKEVLTQIVDWLHQDGRISHRALKRQFNFDDDYLEDVKESLLYTHADKLQDDGQGFVWNGELREKSPNAHPDTDKESQFQMLLRAATGLLWIEKRLTYRELKHSLGLDDSVLTKLCEALQLKRVAIDEEGKVLVWTGESQPITPPVVDVSTPSATEDTTMAPSTAVSTSPGATEPSMPSYAPTAPLEAICTDTPQDEPAVASKSVRIDPQAERRQLTVMFCDLADSTKLSQALDPEDLREVIRAYQQTSAEVIHRFDGYTAQHLGDGLLIYFGWPRAHEDDAQRALHAGLGIVEAVTTNLNPRLEAEKGVQLRVRLGIHTGPVVVGQMGSDGRQENLATGETVNIAARLEGLARPNTVVISPTTARLVEGSFVLEDLGPHELKGITEPMQVFLVLLPAEARRDEDESMPDGGLFLVGRDEEVGLLLRRWEQAKEGLGQVVLISGEAGIGKSSAVATLRNHVAQEGHTRIIFRCSPYHTNSALYPVISHLEQMLGFARDDTSSTKLDKLEQALNTTKLPLEESVPLVAMLLSIPLEDRYPALMLSPQQQRQQTLDTLVAWLIEESEKHPMLSVWEDLHWADPSTLEMLGLVLEQTPTVSVLNVLTFRPEFSPSWPTRSHTTPITLNRLERPQVEALITHLTGDKALPTEVVRHIVTKTDGVPLYVEELTKMLLTSDLLQEEMDQYVLTGPLNTLAIPDTLQDSLMARLDQLNQAKEVAQLGAVIGREFEYELIQAITSQDDKSLQASLAQLVEAELLYQRGRPPRATYIFKHALIQDAAYASLLRSTRQQVHQQIAHLLETRFPELTETQPELVAHHCTEAHLNETALLYWQRAGQLALQRSANLEAVRHLKTSLELLSTLPETPMQSQQELELHIALGSALVVTQGSAAQEVEQAYARARALCEQMGDTRQLFPALRGLCRFYLNRGQLSTARELGEQLSGLSQREADSTHRLEAHDALGHTLFFLGDYAAARTHFERAIALIDLTSQRALAVRHGVAPGVRCLSFLAVTLWCLGYTDQSLQRSQEAFDLAQGLDHPYSLAQAHHLAALLYLRRREALAVQAQADALLGLAQAQQFRLYLRIGPIWRGWALALQGNGAMGMEQIHTGMAATLEMGQTLAQGTLGVPFAEAAWHTGQIEAGQHQLTKTLTALESNEQGDGLAEAYRLQGVFLLCQKVPNTIQAETCFQKALAIACRQQAKSWELRVAVSLARLWFSQGKKEEAYGLLEPVYNWFTEGFDTADLQEAMALLTELEG